MPLCMCVQRHMLFYKNNLWKTEKEQMQFPNSYFEDEVRNGFYVPSLMKRAWAAQLEILEDIDKVCKKYHLQYYAEWGTLLGAVRHGGFIPWDDDLDICMKRKDYDTFLRVGPAEMSKWYKFLNFEHCDEGGYPWEDYLTRIRNGSNGMDKEFLEKFHGFPYIAGVDVFILDYVAPTPELDKLLCEELVSVNTCAVKMDTYGEEEREELLTGLEEAYHLSIDRDKPLKSQVFRIAERVCATFDGKGSKYLAIMPLHTTYGYTIPKEYYADAIMLPFENTQIPVPAGYDGLLKIKYGDYLKAVHDGGAHEYPFWNGQDKYISERRERMSGVYQFPREEIEKDERTGAAPFKTFAENMLKLFAQMKDQTIALARGGDTATAAALLEECQEGAITLGNKIEEIKKDGAASAVGALERYCEAVYVVHEIILEQPNPDIEALGQKLDEAIREVESCVGQSVLKRKEVVFLPYKASAWDSLESVWEAADADPDCDAYVIPIPYYNKDIEGNFGEMHYEADQYPDNVPITDYRAYDFGFRHPDAIYIHNPYDEYNLGSSVHPFFYAKNLRKFTDKLVYIPYFVLDEIKPTDERAVKTLRHFCMTPGVVYADTVIVQSEKMKQTYVDALSDWAGEETRSTWEKKILGLGSPKYDGTLRKKEKAQIPEEWRAILYKKDGTKRKVLLYCTELGSIFEHRAAALDKLESVLALAKEKQEEFALWWRPQPLSASTIRIMVPRLRKRYEKIIAAYRAEGFGIYDDTDDLDRAICLSDAYYGDPCSVISRCQEAGLPIMVQNVEKR